jgi:hypothetical protein
MSFTSPYICHPSETPLSGGAYARNQKRCGALKFNGWYPDPDTLAQLDYSSVYNAKGLFDFYYLAPVTIYTRAKWGGDQSLHPFDEIVKDDYHWYEGEGDYAVKHFRSISDTLIDVKFYLKVSYSYYGRYLSPHPHWILARRPSLGLSYYKEFPPWSQLNKALSEAKVIRYNATDFVWVPPANGMPGYFKPTKDYWTKDTYSYSVGSETTIESEYIEKSYDDRATYQAQWVGEGYLPWNSFTSSYGTWAPTPVSYFKETGVTIDSSSLIPNPYTGGTEGEYLDYTYGIMCRDPDTDPYEFPDDKPYFDTSTPSYCLAAWMPEDNTLCYNWTARKMKIEVWARVVDTCHSCYYENLSYDLSIGYKTGTCKLEAEGNDDPKIVLDFQTDQTEDFTVQIPEPTDQFTKDYKVKTIEWNISSGEAKRITDFKLNSISNA